MTRESPPEARLFFVDTRFQKMARRPGGMPRAQAIENAQQQIEERAPDFEGWLDGELQMLCDVMRGVVAGAPAPDWPESALFHARQLRDVGTTVGYALLTFVAGNLCEILERPSAADASNRQSIACHVDALLLARQRRYRNMRPDQLPELSEGLRKVLAVGTASGGDAK
jgi:hypothetical protein